MKKKKRKTSSFQLETKRRPVGRFGFFRLHARVGRHQRVAAAESADDGPGALPNVGVARALIIILGLHVLAIAGIFVHNHYFDRAGSDAGATEVQPVAPTPPPAAAEPKIAAGEFAYVVVPGDDYAKVAAGHGVQEEDLRVANLNVPLRPGRILRIPPHQAAAVEPPELAQRRAAGAGDAALEPVLVRPAVRPESPGLPAEATAPPPPKAIRVAARGESYQVRPGDTVWRISTRFKVGQEELMKANGIDKPSKLRAGMKLTIPGT
jgi:LysM repeat protein